MDQFNSFDEFVEEINNLEKHARENRTHPEKALYQEAIPRLCKVLRKLQTYLDEEDPMDQAMQGQEIGQAVYIKYTTARTLEDFFNAHKEDADPQMQLAYFALIQDLHGFDPHSLKGLLAEEDIKKIMEEDLDQQAQDPESYDPLDEHGSNEPIPLDQRTGSKHD